MEAYRGWSSDETRCLISIWSDKSVQVKLDTTYRNRAIYEEISKSMAENGFKRTWLQCQRKIKHLKLAYRKAKGNNKRSGKGRTSCPFFEQIDAVVGDRSAFSTGPGDELNSEEIDEMEPYDGEETVNEDEQPDKAEWDAPTPSTSSTSAASEAEGRRKCCCNINAAGGSRRRKKSQSLTNTLLSNQAEENLQLKLQAAQHAHETRLVSMMLQAMNAQPASHHPPQTTVPFCPPGPPSSLSPGHGLASAAAAACIAFICCIIFSSNTRQTS